MKAKLPKSFDDLIKHSYGGRGDTRSNAEKIEHLFANYYGKPYLKRERHKKKRKPTTTLSLSVDDGEVLEQRSSGRAGHEYVVEASIGGPSFDEYVVGGGQVSRASSIEMPQASLPIPAEEYLVDVLDPLKPAPPKETPAVAASAFERVVPAPGIQSNPSTAGGASHDSGDSDQNRANVDDFIADMQSILSGQKVFDPSSKKTVGKKESVLQQSAPSPQGVGQPLPDGKNSQAIFDRIAESMEYANKYDLGTVELTNRFTDFDNHAEWEQKAAARRKDAPRSIPALASRAVDDIDGEDFIRDLDTIRTRQASAAAGAPSPSVAASMDAGVSTPPTLNSPALSTAVANFKSVFRANPSILSFGQFHITNLVGSQMNQAIGSDLAASPDPELQNIRQTMDFDSDALLTAVKSKGWETRYPNIVKAYSHDPSATPAWAKGLYDQFWSTDTVDVSPAVAPATRDRRKAAYEKEKGACFDSTRALARKYIKAKQLPPIPNDLKISQGQIANVTIVSDPGKLDRLVYAGDQALQAVVNGVKKAVDAGYPVMCGLLSGERHDMSRFPSPEHYILVFGRDGDTFVFWDSDAAVSDIAATGWGPGFGVLFATPGGFSTGFDAADLSAIDAGGNHTQLPQRHRYQVYYVQTLPA